MKKVVLKLDLHDDKAKQKAMKAVSTLSGVDSIAIDMKESKLTVIGNVDPIVVVGKLRKSGWHADLLIVGPAKEEKKEEAKKAEPKKEDKKNSNTNSNISNDQTAAYSSYYNPNMNQMYYHVLPVEEDNSTGCVIS